MQKERKKRVSVTFVRDDDIVQHILHIEDKKSDKRQRAAKRNLSYTANVDVSGGKKRRWMTDDDLDVVEDSSDDENPAQHLLTALRPQDEGIAGNEVFSFRTPKRSGQMAVRASEIREGLTPSTPASGKGKQRKTPQSGQGQSGQGQPVSPRTGRRTAAKEGRAPQTTTPYRLRKRNMAAEDSSDDDSVGADSDEDESEEEAEADGKTQTTATLELTTNAEEYFDLHASGVVTSDRTLSRLDLPQMDIGELRAALDRGGNPHAKHRAALRSRHGRLFPHWMVTMCNGFNILLYGVGSKRDLIEQFRTQYLSEFSHLVVNGYFPSLTIKQVLTSISQDILGHDSSFRSPLDHVEFIRQQFSSQEYEDFYLLVHNLDGAMLRGERSQKVLSLLAQIPGVHILASVDHINAPLIWDQTKLSAFRWVWQDMTTYGQYLSETSYENSLLVQQSGGLALRSLAHVMRSLTPNARKIFELLAQFQVENADSSAFIGMSFQDLYMRCREAFLVNSDQTLRAQLVEFRDHKLIRAKKNYDGTEHLLIPIESSALKEFLEQGDK